MSEDSGLRSGQPPKLQAAESPATTPPHQSANSTKPSEHEVVSSPQDSVDLFSILRNVLFLLGVYLYWTGWNYAYYYFYHFGISLHVVQIPAYSFVVYSYSVITAPQVWIWGSVFLILLLASQWKRRLVLVLLTVSAGIWLFPVLYNAAEATAKDAARQRRSGYYAKTIAFVLKPGADKLYPRSFLCQNKYQRLKLLAQTPTNYYVFYQPPAAEDGQLPYAMTYDILRSDVLLAEIELQNITRKGD